MSSVILLSVVVEDGDVIYDVIERFQRFQQDFSGLETAVSVIPDGTAEIVVNVGDGNDG